MARFDGKVVLVSGGASGMGAAGARALLAEGGAVVVGDVSEERGAAIAGELGDAARFVRLDVTSEADWDRAVRAAEDMGGLHGLVNSAGVYDRRSMMQTDAAHWHRMIAIHQTGCFFGMKAAAPAMERSGGGSIVNMSSAAGLRGSPNFAYAAAKWALRGMTKGAALELAGKKIRVNSVHPGPMATEMLGSQPSDEINAWLKMVPLHRSGTPQEGANLVLFLLSDDSAYITGAEIAIDGGLTA